MERELSFLLDEEDATQYFEEEKISDLSVYEIYSSEVGGIKCLNSEKNETLLLEIADILSELDELFLKLNCGEEKFKEYRIFWIADKVEYCLKHCEDKEILKELKTVYDRYLLVSSKLIEGNLRLVIEIAGEYKENSLFSFDDIIQYGNMGLMRAVEKYQFGYDATFTTYACYWIRQFISRNINGIRSVYRIPSNVVYDGYNLINKNNELDVLLGREASTKELSEYIGLSISKIDNIRKAFLDSLSLDEGLGLSYGDIEITRGDIVADPNVDVYSEGVKNITREELKSELKKRLTDKQYYVICKYIGIDGINYGLDEIATFLNVSPQRVGQLKKEAIKRLSLMPSFIKKIMY